MKKIFLLLIIPIVIMLTGCPDPDQSAHRLSEAKAVTAFSFNGLNPAVSGDISGSNIGLLLHNGTDVTALVASFTHTGKSVTVNGTAQVSGVTANDFSSPVIYTVTAADSSTRTYTVTVTANAVQVIFNSLGGSSVDTQTVAQGSAATEPVNPTKTGNGFEAWYKENTFLNIWDFAVDRVDADTTIYAKWHAATDGLSYVLDGSGYSVSGGTTNSETSITIPEYWSGKRVTKIANSAFKDYTTMTSITIPDGVTSMGASALSGCTSLASITIPDGVAAIYSAMLENCTGLTSVTVGSGVISISKFAFRGCTSLTTLNMYPATAPTVGSDVFGSVSGCDLHTTSGVTGYDTDPWAIVSIFNQREEDL